MSSKIRYYLFLIISGLAIGCYLATKDRISEQFTPPTTQEEKRSDQIETPPIDRETEKVMNDKENTPPPSKKVEKKRKASDCLNAISVEKAVNDIANTLESQQILYNSQPLSDCSGIFLRVCELMADFCPAAPYPRPKQARGGRGLARWYHKRGRLKLIQDAESSSEYIKPGAIMFYGYRNKKYDPVTLKEITAPGGIEHIGVVTAVEKNKEGVITNYTLFHGRSTGKIASRTTHHHRNPSREGIPAYGNWNQQWVAVGNLVE